jgi:hypothetical protein
MAVRSALRAGRPLPPENFWYSFLFEAESTPGLGQLKNPNKIVGSRTRDLRACSIVPQPTAQDRGPFTKWFTHSGEDVNFTRQRAVLYPQ